MHSRATVDLKNSWNYFNRWICARSSHCSPYTGHFIFLWLLVRVWFCSAASVSPGDARSQLDRLVLSVWLVTQFNTNVTELLKCSITRCAKRFENTLVQCGSFPSSGGLMVVQTFQLKKLPLTYCQHDQKSQTWCCPAWVTRVSYFVL